jgi:hypothetical protein
MNELIQLGFRRTVLMKSPPTKATPAAKRTNCLVRGRERAAGTRPATAKARPREGRYRVLSARITPVGKIRFDTGNTATANQRIPKDTRGSAFLVRYAASPSRTIVRIPINSGRSSPSDGNRTPGS